LSISKKIILHVGCGKTGTTSLQRNIFSKLDDYACLAQPDFDKSYKEFRKSIRFSEDFYLENEVKDYISYIHSLDKRKVIISDEGLTRPASPSYGLDVFSHVAKRLKKYFPDAHVLVTIRNQLTAIPSHYISHGRYLPNTPITGRENYVKFSEYIKFYLKKNDRGFFRQLKYYKLIGTYLDLFGHENLTVLLFEEVVADPGSYFNKLSNLLDVRQEILCELWKNSHIRNKADTQRVHNYLRIRSLLPVKSIRKIFPTLSIDWFSKYLQKGLSADIKLSNQEIEMVEKIYGEENRWLDDEFKLSLASYGYPLN